MSYLERIAALSLIVIGFYVPQSHAQSNTLNLPNLQLQRPPVTTVSPTQTVTDNVTVYTCPTFTVIQNLNPRGQITTNKWLLDPPLSTQQWPTHTQVYPTTMQFVNPTNIPVALNFSSAPVPINFNVINNTNNTFTNRRLNNTNFNNNNFNNNNNIVVNLSLVQTALKSPIQLVNIVVNPHTTKTDLTCVYNVNFIPNEAVIQTTISVPFSQALNGETCTAVVASRQIHCENNSPICKGLNCPLSR